MALPFGARRLLPATFVGLGIGIAGLALLWHARTRDGLIAQTGSELRAIVGLKASQIADWRAERLADARVVSADPMLAAALRDWLAAGASRERGAALRERLASLRVEHGYARVSLLDAQGGLRLTEPGAERAPVVVDPQVVDPQVRAALALPEASFVDLHRPDLGGGIHLEVVAPLRPAADPTSPLVGRLGGSPVGFAVFEIDPRGFLYPLIQSWPTPSRSGETLLVRREGQDVVFLNELRHRPGTALTLRLPMTQRDLPAGLAVQGVEGVVAGVDYRGRRVLAATRPVPGSPWFVVSKVDREEVVAPLGRDAWLSALLAATLIALAGLGAERLLRHERDVLDAERRTTESRYQALAETSQDDIFVISQEGRLLYVNGRAASKFGREPAQLLGRDLDDLFPRDSSAAMKANMRRVLSTRQPVYEEREFSFPGGPVWLGTWLVPLPGNEEPSGSVMGVARDITAQRRAGEGLRRTARELLESQRVAGLGSYRVDLASGTWTSSAVLDEVFGIADPDFRRDVPGWLSVVHPEERAEMAAYFAEEVVGKRQPFDREYRIVRLDDGDERWVHGLGRLVADGEGRLVEMIGTIQDVTERRRLETQLRQAQKMEAIGQLAGGVAHDFNNLLGVIGGYSEMVLRALGADHPQRKRIEEIRNAGQRAAGLTRQLLAFSRKQAIAPVVLDLGRLVAGLEGMLRRLVPESIQIVTLFQGGAARVRADPGQVEQVIVNLVVNARDAMPEGGRLIIEVTPAELDDLYCQSRAGVRPGRYVQLTVSDTGSGMNAETQSHIFEPFFTTKEVGQGTGLGLATVYGIVKQHGGNIWVYSEPGRGSTFKIYLPFVEERAERVVEPAAAREAPTGRETILLVEDDTALRELSREILEDLGYRVLESGDGDAALEVSARHDGPIDLLLTDMVMPGMTGRQLAERLRAARPALKVLFISGYTNDVVVRSGDLDAGSAFLQKPFTPDGLGHKIREVLGPPV